MAEVAKVIQIDKQTPSEAAVKKPVGFTSVPFSFAFGVVLWIELWLLVSLCAIGYFLASDYFEQLEKVFFQRGKEVTLAVSHSAKSAMESKNLDDLSKSFAALADKDDPLIQEKPISEVFLLDKSGVLLAHSDVTMLSKDKKTEIALKYNNEFFHAGLLVEPGQIYSQSYPYPTSTIRSRASYLLQFIVPEKLDYSVDFATAIKIKEKNEATIHVVMNRKFIYLYLLNAINKFAMVVGIVLASGIIVSLLVLLAFALRARYLQKLWENLLQYKWENDYVKQEIRYIGAKVETIESQTKLVPPRRNQEPPAQDAIFLE